MTDHECITELPNGTFAVEVRLTREELSWLLVEASAQGRMVWGLLRNRAVLALPEEAFEANGRVNLHPSGETILKGGV